MFVLTEDTDRLTLNFFDISLFKGKSKEFAGWKKKVMAVRKMLILITVKRLFYAVEWQEFRKLIHSICFSFLIAF